MPTSVTVKAMSEASRMLGWSEREVTFEGSTLEDLLKALVTTGGQSLYTLIVEKGGFKGAYVIGVNGSVVTSLETPLYSGDRVMTMEMVRFFHGG
jgi:sulfur carrier protein ThiS